jgi:hypothetical protein
MSTVKTKTIIPDELKPLITGGVEQAIGVQDLLPLISFVAANPQVIPGLAPEQMALISQIIGFADPSQQINPTMQAGWDRTKAVYNTLTPLVGGAVNPMMQSAFGAAGASTGPNAFQYGAERYAGTGSAMSSPEQDALAQLAYFTSGQLGQAPATLAAQDAFASYMIPEIEQSLALAGLGRSGAVGESIARGEKEALVPFLTAEMENRLRATGMTSDIGAAQKARELQASQVMSGIGANVGQQALQGASIQAQLGTAAGQQQLQAAQQAAQIGQWQTDQGQELLAQARTDAAAALEAAGMSREIAAQQAEAAYQDFLRQQNLSSSASISPVSSILPAMLGTKQSGMPGGGGMFGS